MGDIDNLTKEEILSIIWADGEQHDDTDLKPSKAEIENWVKNKLLEDLSGASLTQDSIAQRIIDYLDAPVSDGGKNTQSEIETWVMNKLNDDLSDDTLTTDSIAERIYNNLDAKVSEAGGSGDKNTQSEIETWVFNELNNPLGDDTLNSNSIAELLYNNLDAKISNAGKTATDKNTQTEIEQWVKNKLLEDLSDDSPAADSLAQRILDNLDAKVSNAGVNQADIKTAVNNAQRIEENSKSIAKLRGDLVRGQTRILFDRGLDRLNYNDGLMDAFLDATKLDTQNSVSVNTTDYYLEHTASGGYWNIQSKSYETSHSSTSAPLDSFIGDSGYKLYVLTSSQVQEYDLNTAHDIASVVNPSSPRTHSISYNTPQAIEFRRDGTRMYILDQYSNKIESFTLGTAWDVTTASSLNTFDMTGMTPYVEDNPKTIAFKPDGTKLMTFDHGQGSIGVWSLGTAWDITTMSQGTVSEYLSNNASSSIQGGNIRPDGTEAYIIDDGGSIKAFSLSTAWDASTITSGSDWSNSISEDGNPVDVWFDDGGTVMEIAGTGSNAIYQYSIGSKPQGNGVESKQLGFTPAKVQIEATVKNQTSNNDFWFVVKDGAGDSKTIGSSQIGKEIDLGFSDGDITIEIWLKGDTSPHMEDYFSYFK